jgi:hypothetical protein
VAGEHSTDLIGEVTVVRNGKGDGDRASDALYPRITLFLLVQYRDMFRDLR